MDEIFSLIPYAIYIFIGIIAGQTSAGYVFGDEQNKVILIVVILSVIFWPIFSLVAIIKALFTVKVKI